MVEQEVLKRRGISKPAPLSTHPSLSERALQLSSVQPSARLLGLQEGDPVL